MFPRRSYAIQNSLGAPFLRKETKEKKGDKPRNPSPEPEEHNPPPDTGKKRKVEKQAPEP